MLAYFWTPWAGHYHIDEENGFGEAPHVDINKPKTYDGVLDK